MALAGARSKNGDLSLPAGNGLAADDASHELAEGFWTSGQNVRFRDGYACKFDGIRALLAQPAAAAYHVASFPNGSARTWIHTTLTAAYADTGSGATNITGAALTPTASNKITSTVIGGVFVLNTQTDKPQAWGGTGTLATITGWGATWLCKSLRSFGPYLCAMNVTKGATAYESMFKWSHPAAAGALPTSWDETDPTKLAGELDLADTKDRLIDGLQLGDLFCAYKERSIYGVQRVDSGAVMRAFLMSEGHGAMSQNCVAAFPGGHVVLTAGPDLVTHRGGYPTSVLDGRMRQWLERNMSSEYFARSFVVHNAARYEVWVFFPGHGSPACNKALVWNYSANAFGIRDVPNITAADVGPVDSSLTDVWDTDNEPWDGDTTVWDQSDLSQADRRMLMASTAPGLYLADQGGGDLGQPFTAQIERIGMAFGDPSRVKTLYAVMPHLDAPDGTVVEFQVGASMMAEKAPTWKPWTSFVVGRKPQVDVMVSGRFFGLRMRSTSWGQWRTKSIGFDVRDAGRF